MNVSMSVLSILIFASTAFGQAGVSSMSSSALRSGMILSSDQIRVEELVNFHRHQITLPPWDQRIGLDVRTDRIDGKNVFQIGLATHRDIVEEFRMPLNLVLVIDRSGSMSGDRIEKVKAALVALSGNLAPDDLVSIITYSNDATVCLEGTRARQHKAVKSAIMGIRTGGGTNLNAGLMLGYRTAEASFDKKRSNRVILLTDGIANTGVVNESQIASASKRYNDKGIGLSTIGLGGNFNQSLLRELAEAGRGAIHFVADTSDIRRVFVDEFDSLLSPAAAKICLTISVPEGESLPKIYGYEPIQAGKSWQIPIENMSYGATQVVVGRLDSDRPIKLRVNLNYQDHCTSEWVDQTAELVWSESKSADRVLRKNYTIARVANSIRKSAEFVESKQYSKAKKKLAKALKFAEVQDEDVERVRKMAQRQREQITLRQEASYARNDFR